ncbi:MAG: zinc ribbon domain-containing protein [Candidatus Gracilibacteria bacterium]|nr:zinc ribbon domain-containing protein [Candidatus Gracilibacteria bacterium]
MDTLFSLMETIRTFFVGTFSVISSNMSLDLGIKLVLGYFFIIWGAFIIWVIKDITNRTTNILVQAFSIFIILFFTPIFGLPIYLLIRPRTTIFEQYYEEEELEESTETDDLEEFYHCPACKHTVSRDFKFCPKCAFELTISCPSCKKKIHTDWALCPYCGEKKIIREKPITKEKKIPIEKVAEKGNKEEQENIDDKKALLKEKES